jgi:hypothetical protein
MQKVHMENTSEEFSNTPKDVKLSLPQQIFDQTTYDFRSEIIFSNGTECANISRYCPFKYAKRHKSKPTSANFRPNRTATDFRSEIIFIDRIECAKNISRYCPFKYAKRHKSEPTSANFRPNRTATDFRSEIIFIDRI